MSSTSWKDKLLAGVTIGAGLLAAFLVIQTNLNSTSSGTQQTQENKEQHKKDTLIKQNHENLEESQEDKERQEFNEKLVNEFIESDLAKAIRDDVKLERNSTGLTQSTIMTILNRTVVLSLDDLIKSREIMINVRRNNFNDLQIYQQMNRGIFEAYHQILNRNLSLIIIALNLDPKEFNQSRALLEQEGSLRREILRDLAWHFISDTMSKRQLTEELFESYLKFQIEHITLQFEQLQKHFIEQSYTLDDIKYFINCRVDDLAFQKLAVEEYDAIQCLQLFMKNEHIVQLYKERSETLDSLTI